MRTVDHSKISDEDVSNDNVIQTIQKRRMTLLLDPTLDTDKIELTLMNQLTVTALTDKRITTDDSNAAADREIAAALVTAVEGVTGNPFKGTGSVTPEPELPEIDLVPEETSKELARLECDPELVL